MNIVKSIGAILAGLVFIIVSHTVTDKIFEGLGVLPQPEEGLHHPALLTFALAYRLVLSVVGCYIAAYLAPSLPMLHALILGGIGFIATGIIAVLIIPLGLSPAWYPIALSVLALPCGWAGGKIRENQTRKVL